MKPAFEGYRGCLFYNPNQQNNPKITPGELMKLFNPL